MDTAHARKAAARLAKASPDEAMDLGLTLLSTGHPELLLKPARQLAARHPRDARMWQLVGLSARAAGEGPLAYRAFREAFGLSPNDPLILHSHARTALEAGHPAIEQFKRAVSLSPNDGTVFQGLAAALFHAGQPADAIALLESILARNPLWLEGHRDLAHLLGQMGMPPLAALEQCLAAQPAAPQLHRQRIALALEARNLEQAEAAARDASALLGTPPWLALLTAHILSEQGRLAEADERFADLGPLDDIADASLHARHLIRYERPLAATSLIAPLIDRDRNHFLWPYLSLAWRMVDDDRWKDLEADPRLVGVYDIGKSVGDMDDLAACLRALHIAKEAPLDQSVRGGTQTDGNLLLRDDERIQRLRKALLAAVDKHIRQLPARRANHPTLLDRRRPLRIAGSWSVRLTGEGFHTDHVHSQGWLSSAFYVKLPDAAPAAQDRREGWLSLGENRDLVPALAPLRLVDPKVGQLVLFPSTMWHGTRPFSSGERMTVAFDISPPQQIGM